MAIQLADDSDSALPTGSPFVALICGQKQAHTINLLRHFKQRLNDEDCVYVAFCNDKRSLKAIDSILPSRTTFMRGDFDSIACTVLSLASKCRNLKCVFVFDNMVCNRINNFGRDITELFDGGVSSIILTTKAAVIDSSEFEPTIVVSAMLKKKAKAAMVKRLLPCLDLRTVSLHLNNEEVAAEVFDRHCSKTKFLIINCVDGVAFSGDKTQVLNASVSTAVTNSTADDAATLASMKKRYGRKRKS